MTTVSFSKFKEMVDQKVEWRIVANIVAKVQILLYSLALLFVLGCLIAFLVLLFQDHKSETDAEQKAWETTSIIAAVFTQLALSFIFVSIEITAGVILFLATKEGRDLIDSKRKARLVQKIILFNFLLNIPMVTHVSSSAGLAAFPLKMIVFYVVFRFVKELKMQISRSSGVTPTGI